MKKLLLLLLLIPDFLFAKEPLTVVYYNDYAPYSYVEDNKVKGIFIDILNSTLSERYNIKHIGLPWERAQYLVKEGKEDAFLTIPNKERLEYTMVSKNPAIICPRTLFINKNNPRIEEIKKIKTIDDLKPFKLLDYIGNGWGKTNLSAEKGFKRELCPQTYQVILKLSEGRGDIFVQNSEVALFAIKQVGKQDEIIEIKNAITSSPYHFMVSNKTGKQASLDLFDKNISKIRINDILNRYK